MVQYSITSSPVEIAPKLSSELVTISKYAFFTQEYLNRIGLSLPDQIVVSLVPIHVPVLPTQFLLMQYTVQNIDATDIAALDNAFFTVESVKFGPNNILSMDYPFLDIQNIESTSDSLLLMLIQDVSQRICYRIITNHVLKSTIL
jgi:hypothetical protein